jgi:hypothetical protein
MQNWFRLRELQQYNLPELKIVAKIFVAAMQVVPT